mmetsp:Transcript_20147/g.62316  ORF Transcript_20147/g.62316 Transcript_20147/m.62316 type:complete len:336 (-) Transcript_20147:82-1089(-)
MTRAPSLWEQVDAEGEELDVGAYLERIGLSEAPPVTREGLETLLRAHIAHVPWENLDVYGRKGPATITLDVRQTYAKILRKRGGFCFELNVLFGWLLRQFGFDAKYCLARVWRGTDATKDECHSFVTNVLEEQTAAWDGKHAPPHVMVVVRVDGALYVADVGFGDVPLVPLPLQLDDSPTVVEIPGDYSYELRRKNEGLFCLYRISQGFPGLNGIRSAPGTPEPRLLFDLNLNRPASNFAPGLLRCQTDDDTPTIFRAMLLIVRHELDGTKHVLMNNRLRVTKASTTEESLLDSEAEFFAVLARNFLMTALLDDDEERARVQPALDKVLAAPPRV